MYCYSDPHYPQNEIRSIRRDGLSTTPPHEEGFAIRRPWYYFGSDQIVRGYPGPKCTPDGGCTMSVPHGIISIHLHPYNYDPYPSVPDLSSFIGTPGPDYIVTPTEVFRVDNVILRY